MVQLLLASGADPNIGDEFETPPLFEACTLDLAHALIDAGADINAQDENSCNVFAHTIGNDDLLRFFLEHGLDPNHKDGREQTSLHFACRRPRELGQRSVELLLQFGATTVEKVDWSGRTPVEIAMDRGRADLVKILEPLVQNPALKLKIATWWNEQGGTGRSSRDRGR
ncbi:ankyrin repeat-containing domain protein [Mycena haematopus]|nr:ankyrin repeat-containing domain protein [Mycena haematopus]